MKFKALLSKSFSMAAVIGFALCAAVQPASAQVRFDIYENPAGASPTVGSYGALIGTFYSSDVNFGSATGWNWKPLGLPDHYDFAAVVTGRLSANISGLYSFAVGSDDGSVLKIDGATVIDAWFPTAPDTFSGETYLTAGIHDFRIDYFECCGNPGAGLEMSFPASWSNLAGVISFATPVPEPETYGMLLAGLALLGFTARRRKLKQAARA